MRQHRLLIWFVVIALALFGLVACAPEEAVDEPDPDPAPAPDPDPDPAFEEIEELVVVSGSDAHTMDPQLHNNRLTGAIHMNIFDPLVGSEPRQPALATHWEPIDDHSWIFYLREGVVWHDGHPFTAEDVQFTIMERVIAHPESAYGGSWDARIDSVEIIDDYTVKITTNYPDPNLPDGLSSYGRLIVPKHYIEEHGDDHFAENPIGTGAFKFAQWIRDDRVILERFEDYWGDKPIFERAVFRAIPEASTRMAEVMTGRAHMVAGVSPADRDSVDASEFARTIAAPAGRAVGFGMQCHPDYPTGDVRVRHAIDFAIDNQLIVDEILDGLGVPVRTYILADMQFGVKEYYNTYRYDPDEAVRLLEEAGYGPGELELDVGAPRGRYPMDAEIGEFVALGLLPDVGIETNLTVLEWSAYTDRVYASGQLTGICLIGPGVSGDDSAGRYLSRFERQYQPDHAGGVYNYAENPNTRWEEFGDILVRVVRTSEGLDMEKREELVMLAHEIFMEDLPKVFLHQIINLWALDHRLEYEPTVNEYYYLNRIRYAD